MKIAMISGGLGDIGKAAVKKFLAEGFKVSVCDLFTKEDALPILNSLNVSQEDNLRYFKCDSANENEVSSWIAYTTKELGVAQVILANAGVVTPGFLTENTPFKEIEDQFNINFWSAYQVAVQAARLLKKEKLAGRIIFTGSWAAERPAPRISAYCISKAAIRMLAKTLAMELAEYNILVNELALGIVEGGLSKLNQQKDPALRKKHIDSTPIHSLIAPVEVAEHIFNLSRFENFSMTGNTVLIDGGLSLTSKMS